MKQFLLTFFAFLLFLKGYEQVDTTGRLSTATSTDTTISQNANGDTTIKGSIDTVFNKFLRNPFVKEKEPLYLIINERAHTSKDELFYLVTGLLLFLAFARLVFSKYFVNIFRLFFQPTFRQKQTKEQLLQNNLPSLLFNLLFIFSGAAYIALITNHFNVVDLNFWKLFLYSAILLSLLYIVKFLFLRFSGWIFNVKEATGTYIFIVYLINKILGVVLIPFVIIIAFANQPITSIAITTSLLIIGLLFLYRYIISYAPVRKEIRVSAIHFFFYICAFEVIPLLLIYKVLMIYMAISD